MTTDELIKQCRIYKGEKENPFGDGGDRAMFWSYEKWWVDKMAAGSTDAIADILAHYEQEGLTDFAEEDGTPMSLKALLFNRFEEWAESGPEEFRRWYADRYIKGSQ